MTTRCRVVAVLCLTWLASAGGCAQREVISSDRAALWSAAVQAAGEDGFQVVAADETKGHIVAEKAAYTGGQAIERLRMTITCQRVGDAYRARVTVRRAAPDSNVPAVDRTKRYNRVFVGGTGRTVGDYGGTPSRDARIEAATLRRIREIVH